MKNYELTYLIASDISEEETKNTQAAIDNIIQKEESVLFETNYPIKKEGFYMISASFQIDPEKLPSLEKSLKSESRIFRYILLIKNPVKAPPRIRKPLKTLIKKTTSEKPKVELKEIETKLDEILGDNNELK